MHIQFKIQENELNLSENQIFTLLLNTNYQELVITKCSNSEKLVKVTFSIDNKLARTNLINTLEAIGIQCSLTKNLNKFKKITTNDYPPCDKLKYKYKPCDGDMAQTISNVLQTNPHFYVQTMHLLNKFNINLDKVKNSNNAQPKAPDESSDDDDDSEIEETMVVRNPEPVVKQFKREPNLKRPSVLGTRKIQLNFLKKK